MSLRLGALLTHPIQYYSPWLADIARQAELKVFYAHQQTAEGQARAGFGKAFEWDVPLLVGYDWAWLNNVAAKPGLDSFGGCDTPEIGEIIRQSKFDAFLMFGWNRKCFAQAAWACARSKTPLLVRVDSQLASRRSALKRALKRPAYSLLLPRLGRYMSPGVRTDAYLKHYRVPQTRIHRIPHMIDTARFAAAAQAARASGACQALRRAHGAGEADTVLLFVGKLIDKKRPMLMLQALAELRSRHPELAARTQLWIAGDGPLRPGLEAAAREQDLPVRFLGFANQTALPAIYAAADCLVLPSDAEETWGLVVNEAFACGTPAIVSSEAGCAPDLIIEGETGWRMERPEPAVLADLFARAATSAIAPEALEAMSAQSSYPAGTKALLEVVGVMQPGFGSRGLES